MIGIIGGGLAGLSAAYYLQQKGYQVRIFEGEEELGGLAASYDTEGDSIEKFYHHLSKSEETIVELAEELGIGDKVEWKIGKNAFSQFSQPWGDPKGSPRAGWPAGRLPG